MIFAQKRSLRTVIPSRLIMTSILGGVTFVNCVSKVTILVARFCFIFMYSHMFIVSPVITGHVVLARYYVQCCTRNTECEFAKPAERKGPITLCIILRAGNSLNHLKGRQLISIVSRKYSCRFCCLFFVFFSNVILVLLHCLDSIYVLISL